MVITAFVPPVEVYIVNSKMDNKLIDYGPGDGSRFKLNESFSP